MDADNRARLRALAPDARGARRRSGCCASSTPRGGAGDLDVPDPYYGGERRVRARARPGRARLRGLLDELRARASAATRRAPRSRRPAVAEPRRVGGGDINDAYARELADGARCSSRRAPDARARRVRGRGRRACVARPSAGAARARACSAVGRRASSRSSGSSAARARRRREALGRGLARAARARARRRFGACRTAARCDRRRSRCPNTPAQRLAGFYAERPAAATRRLARDAGALPPAARRGRARVRAASTSSPARPSRPRGCTATCGAATSSPAPTARRG